MSNILDMLNEDGSLDDLAHLAVLATMLCPENTEDQAELLETLQVWMASQYLYEAAKEHGPPESVPLHQHCSDWIKKQAGAILDNTAHNSWAGSVAGDLLLWYMQIHTHHPPASMNKAMEIVEQYLSKATDSLGRHGPRSLREIKTAWVSYRAVAPLWAALRLRQSQTGNTMVQGISSLSSFMYDSLPIFLATAKWFREAGTTLYSPGQKVPILDPHQTWCTPPQLLLPSVSVTPAPLEDWAVEVLKQYRAPQRF